MTGPNIVGKNGSNMKVFMYTIGPVNYGPVFQDRLVPGTYYYRLLPVLLLGGTTDLAIDWGSTPVRSCPALVLGPITGDHS